MLWYLCAISFRKQNREKVVRKLAYIAPAVINRVSVELETPILAGSVVTNDSVIQTTGQGVETHDFSDSSFNQVWE